MKHFTRHTLAAVLLVSGMLLATPDAALAAFDVTGATLIATDESGNALGGQTLFLEITPDNAEKVVIQEQTDDEGKIAFLVGDGSAGTRQGKAVTIPRNGTIVVRETPGGEGTPFTIRGGIITRTGLTSTTAQAAPSVWHMGVGIGLVDYGLAEKLIASDKPAAPGQMEVDNDDNNAVSWEIFLGRELHAWSGANGGTRRLVGRLGYMDIGNTTADTEITDVTGFGFFLNGGNGQRGEKFMDHHEVDGSAISLWLGLESTFGASRARIAGILGVRRFQLDDTKMASIVRAGSVVDSKLETTDFNDTAPFGGVRVVLPVGDGRFEVQIGATVQQVKDETLVNGFMHLVANLGAGS